MISDELRAKIRRLYYGEHFKIGTIVSQLGVHESTVRRAVGIDAFATRGRARPSDFDPYIEFVRQTLERYPKLTGTRVHEMIRARGYPGSAVQVRRMIRKHELRPVPIHEVYFQRAQGPLPLQCASLPAAPGSRKGPCRAGDSLPARFVFRRSSLR